MSVVVSHLWSLNRLKRYCFEGTSGLTTAAQPNCRRRHGAPAYDRTCGVIGDETAARASTEVSDWRDAVHELAAFDRPSASEGERRAAEWIAERLGALGCSTSIEEERAHGGYWWPLAAANAIGATG